MKPLFINTRPINHPLSLQGIDSVHLPLLSLNRFDVLHDDEHQAMAKFMAGMIDVVVAVSVEAVRCALDFLAKAGMTTSKFCQKTIFVTVGKPTQLALHDVGITAITPADFGLTMNNEGMLALPAIKELTASSSVLIWRGVGGRQLLYDTLIARGMTVHTVAWYERTRPITLTRDFGQLPLTDHSPIFVPITSQMSLDHWQSLPVPNCIYLPLGERLAKLTKHAYPNATILPIADLTDATLYHTITDFLRDLDR